MISMVSLTNSYEDVCMFQILEGIWWLRGCTNTEKGNRRHVGFKDYEYKVDGIKLGLVVIIACIR